VNIFHNYWKFQFLKLIQRAIHVVRIFCRSLQKWSKYAFFGRWEIQKTLFPWCYHGFTMVNKNSHGFTTVKPWNFWFTIGKNTALTGKFDKPSVWAANAVFMQHQTITKKDFYSLHSSKKKSKMLWNNEKYSQLML